MRNFARLTGLMLAIVACAFHTDAFGQMFTQIICKVKGRAVSATSIYFSDNVGAEYVTSEGFIDDQKVYFTIVPVGGTGNGYFREIDIAEDLSLISLYQNRAKISRAAQLKGSPNPAQKFDKLVLTFNKRDVVLYESFEF